jgi:hypothetical protein
MTVGTVCPYVISSAADEWRVTLLDPCLLVQQARRLGATVRNSTVDDLCTVGLRCTLQIGRVQSGGLFTDIDKR